jgi:hypothetical protein
MKKSHYFDQRPLPVYFNSIPTGSTYRKIRLAGRIRGSVQAYLALSYTPFCGRETSFLNAMIIVNILCGSL